MAGYKAGSLTLPGAVSMGTGVMIGAGIFALTGRGAELAGRLFPLAFRVPTVVTAFSTYSYARMSNARPSAVGVAMYLEKAYGRGIGLWLAGFRFKGVAVIVPHCVQEWLAAMVL